MVNFLQRFGANVLGVLNGFDRLRFRGSNRTLCHPAGILGFLSWMKILRTDFGAYAQERTKTLSLAIEERARNLEVPVTYLSSSKDDKEAIALAQALQRGQESGLIAVLSCVEPCRSVAMRCNEHGLLLPRLETRQCLHYYHYYLDPTFGLMYTRLQSWFPYTMHVGINGRQWLAQQLKRGKIDYTQRGNCFTALGDFKRAQRLLDRQVHADWPLLLERLAARSNPLHRQLLPELRPYYWSLEASEWATDILFRTPADLAAVYPQLVRHGLETMHCADVMRFLGYKVPATDHVHGSFTGEVVTDMQRRAEGTRLKYQVKTNGAKMYDKHGNLRLEVTTNQVSEFKTYRTATGDEDGPKRYRKIRKGVVDVPARAKVCQEINERHADMLATALATEAVSKMLDELNQPVQWHGRQTRGLNPLSGGDVKLLEIVGRGDYMITGFRNRDIREALHGTAPGTAPVAVAERRRQSAAVTRQLRLLRAHDLIGKQPGSHRYQLTEKGQRTITGVLTLRRANVATLLQNAA